MKRPTPPRPAADFASAAMVRVLAQGMAELGMAPDAALLPQAGQVATVPLHAKRELVGAALAQGGWGCLALLGRGLHRLTHEPTHRALASARDAQDLFTRWARLERYIHSRHRVEVQALTHNSARLTHLARPGDPPPLPAEDLVVLGVLLALLETTGAQAVAAQIEGVPVYPAADHTALGALAQRNATGNWTLTWQPAATAPPPRADTGQSAPPIVAPPTWPAQAQRSFVRLSQDLMNPLPLPALAQAQGEAPRSLQRHLGRAGLSYTQVLAQARCSAASWWLVETAAPIAEVGFISGYADQSHFTRDFKSRVGMTPLRFRSDFSGEVRSRD